MCRELIYGKTDFSQPARRYERHDESGNLHFVISHPHKEIKRPAYCYFHRKFPNYPLSEPF